MQRSRSPDADAAVVLSLPAGCDALLDRARLTILGEVHGTKEAPEALLALACLGLERGPVRIGFELLPMEQPAIDALVREGRSAPLLESGYFVRPDFVDGRRSVALIEVLMQVHALRQRGADLDVFTFDRDETPESTRDAAMADAVTEAMQVWPEALLLLLTGNVHARTVRGGVAWDPSYVPMGAFLAERFALTSIDITYRGGEAWCLDLGDELARAHPLHGVDRGGGPLLLLHPERNAVGTSPQDLPENIF